jgi:tubulin epsilon
LLWLPLLLLLPLQGFKLGLCSQPPVGLPYSLLCLSNNCCIADTFSTLMARFDKLYKRK